MKYNMNTSMQSQCLDLVTTTGGTALINDHIHTQLPPQHVPGGREKPAYLYRTPMPVRSQVVSQVGVTVLVSPGLVTPGVGAGLQGKPVWLADTKIVAPWINRTISS